MTHMTQKLQEWFAYLEWQLAAKGMQEDRSSDTTCLNLGIWMKPYMTSSDIDRLESLCNFVFYLYNWIKKYDCVCCEVVLWRQLLKYMAFLMLPLYPSGMAQFYPQIFLLLFIVCNSVIQSWRWSTKRKESFGCTNYNFHIYLKL